MQEYQITGLEQNQRLDKYLKRLLPMAPSSFLYKMLRKKNITLNGHKAEGSEIIAEGDRIKVFLAEETLRKMMGTGKPPAGGTSGQSRSGRAEEGRAAFRRLQGSSEAPHILYEDRHIAAVYKPAGLLSQKSRPADVSLNEWFLGYLLNRKEVSETTFRSYVPSIQNRLDRNTEGVVLLAKTLPGSQLLTGLLRERSIHKYYRMLVAGEVKTSGIVEGYLKKDEENNTVQLYAKPEPGTAYSRTEYRPLAFSVHGGCTLVEAQLITGRTHQLRAHFAYLGHPIVGDPKYGDPGMNRRIYRYGVRRQLLLCQRVEFPELSGEFESLSHRIAACEEPAVYRRLLYEL